MSKFAKIIVVTVKVANFCRKLYFSFL